MEYVSSRRLKSSKPKLKHAIGAESRLDKVDNARHASTLFNQRAINI